MSVPQANDPAPFNAARLKEAQREQWDRSAAGWDGNGPWVRSWLGMATEAMLDMAGVRSGCRVLDVAAGAGDQTLDIAQRVGPAGRVLATDLSPKMLALARKNAEAAGCRNVQTQVADGESLPVQPGEFDSAVSRLGLMFFPDPLQGLREMHRALVPDGRACTMVFSGPDRNPCVVLLMSIALKHAGLAPRDPFQSGGLLSLGKPGLADRLFVAAGFRDVATTTIDAPFRLPSARHYLDFVRTSASPIQQILGRLSPAAAEEAWHEMEERLSVFSTPGGWEGPNELLLTAALR
jgi:SAM-dependent methyltransferase